MRAAEVQEKRRRIRKRVVVVSVMIPITLLHFLTGSNYKGPYPHFVNGYLLDILVPFGFYILLCLPLRNWIIKGGLVFGAASLVEITQLFGAPIFGRTFDPLDFIMYAIGVTLAAVLDTMVFPQIFEFWAPNSMDHP